MKKRLLIRQMHESDIDKILLRYTFPWSTPEKTRDLWNGYFKEQLAGIRVVAVICEGDEILGYGSFLKAPECPFFVADLIPEINAVWIDETHRNQGLGTALIEWIENLASKEGYKRIGIGVGLYRDYGPAQKLYFKLGYAPEGKGITYKGKSTEPGKAYPLDDDLIFWLVKELPSVPTMETAIPAEK